MGPSTSTLAILTRYPNYGVDKKDELALVVSLSDFVCAFLLVCIVVLGVLRLLGSGRDSRWKVQEVAFSFGGTTTRLTPDDDVARIAHQAWTELVTRKAGLQIDNDDVIIEVYDSWYHLFGAFRLLSKEVPVSALHKPSDAKTLLDTLMKTMNDGLRPHLTKYQATFRRWWELASDNFKPDISPQKQQRAYPHYDELMSDMLVVNRNLIELAEAMRKLAHEREAEPLHIRIFHLIYPKSKQRKYGEVHSKPA